MCKLALALAAMACFVATQATAKPHLNWGGQTNAAQCTPNNGKLVINVVQQILNDADSGVAGNAWANDTVNRQIQVWQLNDGTFCALVKYQGSFTTFAGASPGGTSTVEAGVTGTFEGGYTSTSFTGTLKATPAYRTKGNIGMVDYACVAQTFNCPGYVDWTTLYFDSTSGFDLAWWGWVYHAGNNGDWVNAISGNSGDITGN